MDFLILAAALLFLYFALQHLMVLLKTQDPTRTMILFIYCLLAGFYLLYQGWPVLHTGGRLFT